MWRKTQKYEADFLVSGWLVLIACTSEFIKMSGQCLATQLSQKVANNRVCQWEATPHTFCRATCGSGCHLCFVCKHSYLTVHSVATIVAVTSVSRVKVLLVPVWCRFSKLRHCCTAVWPLFQYFVWLYRWQLIRQVQKPIFLQFSQKC